MTRIVKGLWIVFFSVLLSAGESSAFSLRRLPESWRAVTSSQGTLARGMISSEAVSSDGKSTTRAVLYSLLLPGLGQRYLGETTKAKFFFIAEAAVWTSFVVFRIQGHVRKERYKDFAMVFAGITSRNHSDSFYREIGDYDSSDDYEVFLKEEGREVTYPYSDYATLDQYYLNHRVADFEPWAWRSSADRKRYFDIRWGSRLAYRRSLYTLAAALANRVASAVYAVKSARAASALSAGEEKERFRLTFSSLPEGSIQRDFSVMLVRGF
jgi:hypothetical protein